MAGVMMGGVMMGGVMMGGVMMGGGMLGGDMSGGVMMGGQPEQGCEESYSSEAETITGEVSWPCGTYMVSRELTVSNGTLTLEPCAKLMMAEGSSIQVESGGRLVISGTEDCPVTMTTQFTNPVKGAWAGVRISETASAALEHARIEYAGSSRSLKGAIMVEEGGALSVHNSIIKSSARAGIYLNGGELTELIDSQITDNELAPIISTPHSLGALSGLELSGNAIDEIQIDGGSSLGMELRRSTTWADHGVPYRIANTLKVVSTSEQVLLRLEEGVTLMFNDDSSLELLDNGALIALGSEDRPLRFTSSKGQGSARGDWGHIKFEEGSLGALNQIEHASVEFAGGHVSRRGAIRVEEGAQAKLSQLTVRDSKTEGIAAYGELTDFKHNTLSGNQGGALLIGPSLVGALGEGVYGPNDLDAILIDDGTTTVELKLYDHGVPYITKGDITINAQDGPASWTLYEGVTLKIANSDGISTRNGGRFLINGQAERRVTITSENAVPTPGDWNRIHLTESGELTWSYADISYGGNIYDSAVTVSDGTLNLNSVTISNSLGGCDLEYSSDVTVNVDDASSLLICE